MRYLLSTLLACVLAFGSVACGTAGGGDGTEGTKPESNGKTGKEDQWNWTNNPERFEIEFDYDFETLVANTEGRAEQTPWPSDYWSYYEDSINVKYHGANTLSPAEKYDKAFNGWTPPEGDASPLDVHGNCKDGVIVLEDAQTLYYDTLGPAANWQHNNKGNGKVHNGKDDDDDGKTDECGDDYDGIETWWGLCHAWVPAAILEPEPQHPVTVNGVEFTVSDIKALLIAQYDRSSALMLGGRCNEKELERDETGRIKQDECRDTNPGSFFVVTTNLLGIQKRAFAEDRTTGYQVWNQPILGYRIKDHSVLTEEDAMEKLEHPGEKFHDVFDSPEAVSWRYVKMDTDYISESNSTEEGPLAENIGSYTRTDKYEMVLEIDADGKVVGGEWINYTMDSHPDFLWLPIRGFGGNPHMSLAKVKEILELSRQTETPDPPDATLREFAEDVDIPIPDDDEGGIARTLVVDDDIDIDSLKVRVKIDHTYVGDLLVKLEKDGHSVTLHDRTGGGTDNLDETYDVYDFNGTSAKGEWTITVTDHAASDTGALKNWTLVVGTGTGGAEVEVRSFSSDATVAIPDDDDTGITSVIAITDAGVVRGIKVTVDITHTYIGDLIVEVVHGTQTQVMHGREGGSADDIQKTYTVTGFDGGAMQGDWTLHVADTVGQDVGTLNSWSMDVIL